MRKLSAYTVVGPLILLLAGCGGSPKEDAQGGESGSAADSGKVLRININAEVKDLDPHLVTGVPEHRVLASLFDGLTGVDPATFEPLPAAAESWTISEDKLVYTFKLRADGKWSNGDPVTNCQRSQLSFLEAPASSGARARSSARCLERF